MRMKLVRLAAAVLFACVASTVGAGEMAGLELHGFLDGRAGLRTQTDPTEKDASLAELRAQTSAERIGDRFTATLRADWLLDAIPEDSTCDLETGAGWLDLREANLSLAPAKLLDVKVGRQILTWGVGDMLFINDLFPKDWQAFFSGRDTDYLKAPSDALLLSLYPGPVDLDVVYTPRFDADRFIDGTRLSYWNPMLNSTAGRDAVIDPLPRDDWFRDDELAVRVRRMIGGTEAAVYGYSGYWKSPEGFDTASGRACFPRLTATGASLRGALAGGVASLESGYYDSRDDRNGDDPAVPNSQWRALAGYERELIRDLQGGAQYYLEAMQNYGPYRAALPDGQAPRDARRQVATLRLTKLAMNQNLKLSLFLYLSPTDQDAYLRPSVEYKASDTLTFAAGGNLFTGRRDDTFFGQFEDNSNLFASVRYAF